MANNWKEKNKNITAAPPTAYTSIKATLFSYGQFLCSLSYREKERSALVKNIPLLVKIGITYIQCVRTDHFPGISLFFSSSICWCGLCFSVHASRVSLNENKKIIIIIMLVKMFAVASGCLFVLNVRRFFVSKRRSFLFLIIFRLRFCRHRKREKKVHAKSTWIYNEAIHTHANRLTLLIEAKNKPLYMRATTKFLRCC